MEECGIEKECLRMVNVSAAEAPNLVKAIFEMVNIVKELGPNPIKNNKLNSKEEITK